MGRVDHIKHIKQVRIGIIGFGNMGSGHGKCLVNGDVPDAVLSAVCDIKPERLEAAKEICPDIRTYISATDMFASGEIDAVIISVPHYSHPPLAIEAFGKGIHVMCEKPAGVYTKQVAEMNREAEKSNVVFGMMFNQRTNCIYRKMHEMVVNGELGEIRRSNWIITNWYRSQTYYDSGDWRATWAGEGGGVLLNQCPHNLDLWQWICGMPIKVTAFCHEGKWRDIEVEDDVTAYVEYPNGATGVFVTTTGDAPGSNRFEVTGDRGRLICENSKLYFDKLDIPESEFNKTNKIPFGRPDSKAVEVETDGLNPGHKGVLIAFTDAILRGGKLIASGTEGIFGLTLSNAMHLSSWLGKTIEIPFDEDLFYDELKKRIALSKKKDLSFSAVADLSNTYNS